MPWTEKHYSSFTSGSVFMGATLFSFVTRELSQKADLDKI